MVAVEEIAMCWNTVGLKVRLGLANLFLPLNTSRTYFRSHQPNRHNANVPTAQTHSHDLSKVSTYSFIFVLPNVEVLARHFSIRLIPYRGSERKVLSVDVECGGKGMLCLVPVAGSGCLDFACITPPPPKCLG